MMTTNDTPRVYVGTYAKYNDGNLSGFWADLSAFPTKEEFLEACREHHADESDPELMFQDFSAFPRSFYSESDIDEELWDWMALDQHDRDLLEVYREHIDSEGTIEEAREAYSGTVESKEDWAWEYLEDTGAFQDVPEMFRTYFDADSFARDAELNGDITFVERSYKEVWVLQNI